MLRKNIKLFIFLFAALFVTTAGYASDDWLLQVTVQKSPQNPLEGITVYLFDENGSYLGYQFWSDNIPVAADTDIELTIPHQDVTITVEGDYPETEHLVGVPVYLFTQAGTYMGENQTTDAAGQVNLFEISTGGGVFSFTVLKAANDHLVRVNC